MCILSGSQCVQYRDISRTCQARSGVSWIAGSTHYCQDMRGEKEWINNEKRQNELIMNGKVNNETEEMKDGGINERKWEWILKNQV
jgi:hypothetical protein